MGFDEIIRVIIKISPEKRGIESLKIAHKIRNDDIKSCKKIGKYGLEVIKNIYKKKKKCVNILTHCNAGWLATVDWGTALAPIFYAKRKKYPYIFGLMKLGQEIRVLCLHLGN